MEWLRALTRADLDRRRCAELRGTEHPIQRVEDDRMRCHRVEGTGLGEQSVHAAGAVSFEVVAAVRIGGEQALQLGARRGNRRGIEHVLDDAVAVDRQRRALLTHAAPFPGSVTIEANPP